MPGKGKVIEHSMFAKSFGTGCGWGCNAGRIAASPMTFASSKTEDGRAVLYIGEGRVHRRADRGGLLRLRWRRRDSGLQAKLRGIGKGGFRHHVGVTFGSHEAALREAFGTYLGYSLVDF